MNHDALQALLPLYALGALDPEESGAVDVHLAAGCPTCADELRGFQSAATELAYTVPPVSPPDHVRQEILHRLQEPTERGPAAESGAPHSIQVWRSWTSGEPSVGLSLVRAGDGIWEESLPGVRVKRLSADPQRRTVTMLVRMDPGATYPPHRHAAAEECYVLSGDLHVGDELVMHAGDFQRAERDTVHVRQWTASGCALLVTSSIEDDLVA